MPQNILLYGNSIFLHGLAAWLHSQPGLTVHAQPPAAAPDLPAEAEVVIVDIHETPVPEAVALFGAHPRLTIVGVDARRGTATVLSGQVHPLHTMADVLHSLD